MFICPSCGGRLAWSPEKRMLLCTSCHNAYTASQVKDDREAFRDPDAGTYIPKHGIAPLADEKESFGTSFGDPFEDSEDSSEIIVRPEPSGATFAARVHTCPACGAELLTSDETAVTFCHYCGTQTIIPGRLERLASPDRILPFTVPRAEAEDICRKRFSRAFLAPSGRAREAALEQMHGIYMPYWIYDFHRDSAQTVTGEKSAGRDGDYTLTDDFSLRRQVKFDYTGLSYDSASSFYDELSHSISPYNVSEAVPFDPSYMSGFYADAGDVSSDVYLDMARDIVRDDVADKLLVFDKSHEYSRYHVDKDSLRYAVTAKHVKISKAFFPVWFLAFRDRDRISYSVVNGQTGESAVEAPVSLPKYLLLSLALAVPLFLLLAFATSLSLTPGRLIVLTVFLAALSAWMLNRELNALHIKEGHLADFGLQSVLNSGWTPPKTKTSSSSRTSSSGTGGLFLKVFFLVWALPWLFVGLAFLFSFSGLSVIGILLLGMAGFGIYMAFRSGGKKSAPDPEPAVREKPPMSQKVPHLLKPAAAVLVALGVRIFAPVDDLWYYIGALIGIALVVWSFTDAIRIRNRLLSQPLPQFRSRNRARTGASALALFLAAGLALLALSPAVRALAAPQKTVYTNPSTGYTAVIRDEADLLSASEEAQLLETMKPITQKGHVLFISNTDSYSGTTNAFAKSVLHDTFAFESATLFLVDMHKRQLYVFSYGDLWDVITNRKAETITDNVYRMASKGDYYSCAKKVFEQENALLRGARIAEPMRYITDALLALYASCLITFLIVRSRTKVRKSSRKELLTFMDKTVVAGPIEVTYKGQTRTYSPRTSSSSSGGSSCSSCSSSSCSSCSSGGSSCSSCGGGGGHSF